MKIMKKISSFLIAAVVSVSVINITPVYGNTGPHLLINYLPAPGDVKPILKEGSTLVPIRVISETLGAEVDWDQETKKVTITTSCANIEMTINNPKVNVNGAVQTITTPPIIHKDSTMLPIRFVGEALGATVSWDSLTKTASVVSGDIAKPAAPDFTHDLWERKVKTSDLPNNAVIFPYIAEEVPNWVYEKVNMTTPSLASKLGVKQTPREFFSTGYDFDKAVNILNNHFETVLNIDYKTMDRQKFKTYIDATYSDDSFDNNLYSNMEWAAAYVDYIIENKITTKGSAVVLPEMFWTNKSGETIVSAWVTLEVTTQELTHPRLVFQDFGNFPIDPPSGRFPQTETGKKYEGLVQFKMTNHKVDYKTNSIIDQIHPEVNGFGGAHTGK